MEKVTLSIVHYRQLELLDRCLSQLESLSLPADWETILVDNSPEVGVGDMVQRRFPWIHYVPSEANLGFGGGHNLAYARSDADVFFVLNPDVVVLPGAIETLVRVLSERPEAAIVGPRLLNPDQTPQHSARRFYDWRTVFWRRLPLPGREKISDDHLMKDRDLSTTQPVEWLLGAALAIRRSAFSRPDLFDPRYSLYFEDVDLCYFAQRAGWQVLYCPEATMIHDHQRASAGKWFTSAVRRHFMSWVKFYLKTKTYRVPAGDRGPQYDDTCSSRSAGRGEVDRGPGSSPRATERCAP
jgi:GT2 family glycosyltransferase